MRARAFAPHASITLLVVGCATVGSEGEGNLSLPTSGVGPFRKLTSQEVLGVAPFVVDSSDAQYREPAALAVDDNPSSTRVALYLVAHSTDGATEGATAGASPGAPHDVIVRTRADDARSFFGTALDSGHAPAKVLAADAPWEGGGVRSPSALRVGARVYLYYAAAGGVGLAVSDDGLAFQKSGTPVLARDATVTWEKSAPAQPSVAVFPDGRWHMMYAAGGSIGEAVSDDGFAWSRVDGDPSTPAMDPVLGPSAPVDPSTLAPGERPPFDTGEVADPCLSSRTTPAGRLQVRVLYTGYDLPPGAAGAAARASAIGFAARYQDAGGDAGPLARNANPVYAVGKHEAAPALFAWDASALLYVHQDTAATASSPAYPAIAAAFAPATGTLGAPASYADGP